MQKAKKGRPANAKLNAEQILHGALDLCAKGGVEGMTLRSLARMLKVDPMAIYHYFPDRKTLLAAALAYAYRELAKPFSTTRDAAGDVLEQLELYRRVSGRQTELLLYLMGQRTDRLPGLEAFNASLLQSLQRICSDAADAAALRDVLIDYTHGFTIAARYFNPAEKRAGDRAYRAAVLRILNSAK